MTLEVLLGALGPYLVQQMFWSKFGTIEEAAVCVVLGVSLLDAVRVRVGPWGNSITSLWWFGSEEC